MMKAQGAADDPMLTDGEIAHAPGPNRGYDELSDCCSVQPGFASRFLPKPVLGNR